MSKYAYEFVVINTMPTNIEMADSLSTEMMAKYGVDGWRIVNVTPIPNTNPPGMLITFQKEI